ncbi:hypothetical protein U5817_09875 [Aromatoleum evansii]|uniref:Uncharacterized protein n=1 Tax=Aromatoleum evansii TaxID=59406 RepID=A0ABZ1ASP8_AROEV|nr:hypothetical protein U5817_09525 [Aromatoleum evansii]WRL48334.1 hypothetical protein U5817_09875 [Aromatoleum evansii]
MPKIPKGDGPTIAYFFLLLAMMVLMFVGVFVGVKGFGELLSVMMWAGM